MPDFFNTWLPFIYLYGVGGIFFFAGMYIIIKSGSLNLKRKNHRGGLRFYLEVISFL